MSILSILDQIPFFGRAARMNREMARLLKNGSAIPDFFTALRARADADGPLGSVRDISRHNGLTYRISVPRTGDKPRPGMNAASISITSGSPYFRDPDRSVSIKVALLRNGKWAWCQNRSCKHRAEEVVSLITQHVARRAQGLNLLHDPSP